MHQNPYESPQTGELSPLTYYQVRTTKLSIREYRRISKNWLELTIGVWLKLLHFRVPMTFAFSDTDLFQKITPQSLSARACQNIKPVADEAMALSLNYAFSYSPRTVGTIESAAAAFYSEDGRSVLLIVYARAWTPVTVDEKTEFAFVTQLANSTVVATSGSKGNLDTPANILSELHPGKPMHEVFERHRTRLRESNAPVVGIHSSDQLEHMLRRYEQENFEFCVKRGIYVPISHAERERLQRLAVKTPDTPKVGQKPRLQGVEVCCWIVLAITLFMFTNDQPANRSQAVFRMGIVLIAGAGIASIWLFRFVNWILRKSK
jgi:hypothetical protein